MVTPQPNGLVLLGVTQEKQQDSGREPRLFRGIRPVNRAGAVRDVLAGFTLAAMNVPQALGYTHESQGRR